VHLTHISKKKERTQHINKLIFFYDYESVDFFQRPFKRYFLVLLGDNCDYIKCNFKLPWLSYTARISDTFIFYIIVKRTYNIKYPNILVHCLTKNSHLGSTPQKQTQTTLQPPTHSKTFPEIVHEHFKPSTIV